MNNWATNLHTSESGRSTSLIMSDAEGLGGELVEDTTRVVEKLQGLITSVLDSRGDLQVVHTVNLVSSRERQGEAWHG